MCFSAPASFVAGSALSAAGAATIKKAKLRSELPFAMIPLVFGVQQVIEGLVWLSFRLDASSLNTVATQTYTLFSYVLWPVYLPYAVRELETVPWRKKALSIFQLIGTATGAYLLYSLARFPFSSQIVGGHIVYASARLYGHPMAYLYIFVTSVGCLFSSHRLVNAFGVLTILSAIVTYRIYAASFASVWCFFAAILSSVVVLYFYGKKSEA